MAILAQLRIIFQVVVAIRESEPALNHIKNLAIGLLRIAIDEPDERVDQIQLEHARKVPREVAFALQAIDRRELVLQWRESQLFDSGLVHEALVEVTDLLRVAADRFVGGRGGFFGNRAQVSLRLVDEHVEGPV